MGTALGHGPQSPVSIIAINPAGVAGASARQRTTRVPFIAP